MKNKWLRMRRTIAVCLLAMTLAAVAMAQAVSTTTVQGTVYLANGQPGAGTLLISWPSFTTAAGQAVAADSITVAIGTDGFMSVNLAANLGATPAGEFYTAVYDMSDGTTSTQYWVVPAAANASLAAVQAQIMPAAQAVQTVSKAYVDEAIAELSASSGLSASGGTLTGPLYLSGDPTQPLQASDKHYVDTQVATAVPLAGGNMTGALTTPTVNGVQAPAVASAQTTLQAAMTAAGTNGAMVIPPTYAGTDTFTNANGVKVTDLRTSVAQQAERSVKEFGAVCDGVTDDTNALQAALNYANAHGVALTIPQGTCKTRALSWHGESIGGLGKQVSALMGFPGQDVLESGPDATNMLSYTRLHDLTIYVDQSEDVSCSPAEGRAAAGSCAENRPVEVNSIFSPGGSGLTGTAGTGAAWNVGNCAIAMQATTGAGGNGLRVAEMENVEITTTGTDPMAAQYPGAHSTHTCGLYLAQWPQWSEFRNIDIRGLNTGVAIPALPGTTPAGLNADSNRWQNVTIQATHAFTAAAGSNNVLDNVVALAGNSSATGEPPTGLVLDLNGASQGWTVRNAVVAPAWNAVAPTLTVTASGGAVTAVTLGSEHGLGWDPYGVSVPVAFSGSCTAQANATVTTSGAITGVTVTQGGVGCSTTTTASLNAAGTWDTAAPVNLIDGQNMTFFAGNLLKGNGGYTVWNAGSSASYGTQLDSGGGTLPGGGTYAALAGSGKVGSAFQVDQFPGADIGAKIQACVNAVNATYGGTCDARNFTGNLTMGSNLTISTSNTAILLPCATITTANQIVVTAGSRNVALRGCALRGGSEASGSTGGTALAYTGSGAMVEVGDPTYATDTPGFHMDNVVINTTEATSATAQGLVVYRTQELDLESLYFLGNSNQTGMTLDGTGNYTGGTFFDNQFSGFGTAINAIGHQVTNPATTDWMNASTFVRLHIDCPTSGGSPISGTYGINLQQGDGNTFTGGDVESCSTALHLGPNAQNNTIVGLRNENSTSQVVADAGSSYNNWMTGGTMFTGKLTDNGTRNSFLDTFHRSFNELNGDWYLSQQDATLTNHFRLGIGAGNERGLLNEIQTDYGYRWLYGFSDAAGGQQLYQMDDLLNNVYRLQIQQWNSGESSTNNETALNAAGTGNVCFNCSTNSGTGGVTFASGGTTPAAVGTVDKLGDAQFVGNLLVGGTTQSTGTVSLRNSADAEVDYYLWPGLTTSQKGSFTYKDWNGNSQWYLVKDASNNWELNSATGGLDSFKAYQSTNTGDTYIDASNSTGHVRFNYETGSGAETDIYSGSSANLDAAFLAPNAIKFPGLAASSGDFCLQIDNSGYMTNTGSPCGTGSGSGGGSGTINSGSSGQIAYYTTSGTVIGGTSAVPLASGGTGATTVPTGNGTLGIPGPVVNVLGYGGVCNGSGSDQTALAAAFAAATAGDSIYIPASYTCVQTAQLNAAAGVTVRIDGTLQEEITGQSSANTGIVCAGSCTINGSGTLAYNEDGSGQSAGISVSNGAIDISGVTFTSPNSSTRLRYGITILQSGTQTISSLILSPKCVGIEYCFIRSTSTTSSVTQALIKDIFAYNLTGDAIEWNVGPLDGPIDVTGGSISDINSTKTNEGIAVGFAGEAPYAYPQGNPQQKINVTGLNISNIPEGIHCELCFQFSESGNQISGVNPSRGVGAGLDSDAVEAIGSFDVSLGPDLITENSCGGFCVNVSDGVASAYVPSTENVVINGDTILNTSPTAGTGILVIVGRSASNSIVTEPANVTIKNNHVINGTVTEKGVNNFTMLDNAVQPPIGVVGFTQQYNGYLTGPSTQYLLNIQGNTVKDVLGQVNVSIAGTADPNSFGNVLLLGGGNNFPLTPMTAGGSPVSYVSYAAGNHYVTNQTVFPQGPTYQTGDIIYSLAGPEIWTVTSSGTSVPSSDTFAIDSSSGGTIHRTGAPLWDAVHMFGQLIHLSDGTHTANAVVGSVYFSGADSAEAMTLLNPSTGAALNLGAMGSGTITATNAVAYTVSGSAFSGGLGTSYQDVTETAAPSDPASGNDRLYLDSTKHLLACLTSGGGSCMPPGGSVTDGSGTTTTPEFAESTSAAHVLQYRTPAQALSDLGAAAAPQNATVETASWLLLSSEPYRVNCSTVCTGTLPSSIATGYVAAVNNVGTATVTIASGGPVLVCSPVAACTIPPGGNGVVYTDGTDWYLIDGSNATEINGGAVPASAAVIATNSSAQPVSAATTGSGNVVLATSPSLSGPTVSGTLAGASETLSGTLSVTGAQTLTGATTMQSNASLENGANSNQMLAIQPGTSAEQIGAVQFNSYTGTSEWQVRKDASNNLRVTDAVNSLDRLILPANANTTINAGAGANAVAINNTSGSGTSGFIVYEGGTNNSTAAFQVSGSGNTTATGYLQGKFIMGAGTMGVAAGAAAGSSPTIACATGHVCDGVSGTVTLTTGTSPTTGTLATLNFPNTHTNQANCMVSTLSSTGMVTSNTWTESTTAVTITANTALTASTAYTIKYWCGSY